MKKHSSTIPLEGTDLPQRLRELREQKYLTQADLADKAGLTYKTVHALENGARPVIMEKTLMLLAQALDAQPQDLLEKYENGTNGHGVFGWRRPAIVAAVLLCLLAASGWVVFQNGRKNAAWEMTESGLVVRDANFGIELWRVDAECRRAMVTTAPWSEQELIYCLLLCSDREENLFCVERSTGKVIWEVGSDMDAMIAAFGADDVMAGKMRCQVVHPADLDADGEPEIIALFNHSLYYPFAVCWINREGELLGQYAHKGHLKGSSVQDLDGDGKDEVLAVGVNNSKAYQGASYFILDDEHFAGASVDSLTDNWSTVPDSALVRVVIPNFPTEITSLLNDVRIGASDLELFDGPDGNLRIRTVVGPHGPEAHNLIVVMDSDLNPLGVDIKDDFLAHINASWPDSLKGENGPAGEGWREQWLESAIRFEAGHRQQAIRNPPASSQPVSR